MFAKIGRDAEDRLKFENEFASVLRSITAFFDELEKQNERRSGWT